MKKILKVTSVMGVATLIKMFAGLARAKFIAWMLGPAGMGVVGQATMYSVFALQFCSLQMGMGMMKGISESLAHKREDRVSLVVNMAGTLQLAAFAALAAITLPFSGPLTKFIFSDGKYWIYFVAITLTTPLALYQTGMASPIFYGYKKIADVTTLTVATTLAGMVILFALGYFYGTEGVLAQIAAAAVASFLISHYLMKRGVSITPRPGLSVFRQKESRPISASLFKYSLVSFIVGNAAIVVMIFLRGLMIKQYGIDANGFYQVAYAMSAYYLPFVTNGVWGHFYPEMCALRENRDINRELNQFLRFAVFASTAIAAGCIIFRKYLILVLFSAEFMKAYDLLAIQAAGDIFFVLFYIFVTSLTARRKFRDVVLISMVAYNAALVGLYYGLSHFANFGINSLNIAIAAANVIFTAVALVHARFDTGFTLSGINIGLIFKSAALIALVLFIPGTGILACLIKTAIAVIWFAVSVTPQEAKGFAALILSPFRRKAVTEDGY